MFGTVLRTDIVKRVAEERTFLACERLKWIRWMEIRVENKRSGKQLASSYIHWSCWRNALKFN